MSFRSFAIDVSSVKKSILRFGNSATLILSYICQFFKAISPFVLKIKIKGATIVIVGNIPDLASKQNTEDGR